MSDVFTKKLSLNPVDISDVHREVLYRMHQLLIRDVIFDPVHDFFVTKRVFDDITLEDIREEPKNSRKIRALLEYLKKADQNKYHLFKEGLRKTRQEHLAERMEEVEKIVIQEFILEQSRTRQSTSDQGYRGLTSAPQPVPTSPIAQPTPSIDGSPSFKDVHQHS